MNTLLRVSRSLMYRRDHLGMSLRRVYIDTVSGGVTLSFRCEVCQGIGSIHRPTMHYETEFAFDGSTVVRPVLFQERDHRCPICEGRRFCHYFLGSGYK